MEAKYRYQYSRHVGMEDRWSDWKSLGLKIFTKESDYRKQKEIFPKNLDVAYGKICGDFFVYDCDQCGRDVYDVEMVFRGVLYKFKLAHEYYINVENEFSIEMKKGVDIQ